MVAATPQLTGKPPMASFGAPRDDLITVRDLCPPAGLKGCKTIVSVRLRRVLNAVTLRRRPGRHNPAARPRRSDGRPPRATPGRVSQ